MSQKLPTKFNDDLSGNPRNKVALKPGRSLMDWIRLGNTGRDLTGVGGPGVRRSGVSMSELASHNTEQDAWIAVRGTESISNKVKTGEIVVLLIV